MPKPWIDSHCHLDASEFDPDRAAVRARAHAQGVQHCVIPAVEVANFAAVRQWAHAFGDSYCLGIHPLYVPDATEQDLATLDTALADARDDPHLVAVGEIGLDFFVPALCTPALRDKQEHFYRAQLQLARKYGLPVVLHVRRSADRLLKYLRELQTPAAPWSGIAHAFNGSDVQAQAFVALGFKLGFGGAVTFERAQQLRRLVQQLPLEAIVLESDAPDMPPHWCYTTAADRAAGVAQGRNEPGEVARIGSVVAALRGISESELRDATTTSLCVALPRVGALLV